MLNERRVNRCRSMVAETEPGNVHQREELGVRITFAEHFECSLAPAHARQPVVDERDFADCHRGGAPPVSRPALGQAPRPRSARRQLRDRSRGFAALTFPTRTAARGPGLCGEDRRCSARSVITRLMPSAIACGSYGSTSKAASPVTSGSDETFEVTTGCAAGHRLERRQTESFVQRRERRTRRPDDT